MDSASRASTSPEESIGGALWEEDWDLVEELVAKQGTQDLFLKFVTHEDKWGDQIKETKLQDLMNRISPDPNPAICRLLAMEPKLAEDPTSVNAFPLHLAVRGSGMSAATLTKLKECFPEGFMKQDYRGETPLHYAFSKHSRWRSSPEGHCCLPEQKLAFLIQGDPEAAKVECKKGNLPMHLAAMISSQTNPTSLEILRLLHEANPEAVRQRNKQGKLPLCLALEQKPVNKPFARALLALYDPDPFQQRWLDVTKASMWVQENYSAAWRTRWLALGDFAATESDPGGLPEEIAEKKVEEPNPQKKRKLIVTASVDRTTRSASRKQKSVLAEDAIKFALDWLSEPKELGAVACTSKILRDEVPELSDAWTRIVAQLEKKPPPLHAETIITDDFPQEFVDPRHRPSFAGLSPHQKAMYMGQYRELLFELIFEPKDDDAMDFFETVLEDIHQQARDADDHGFFEPDDFDDEEEDQRTNFNGYHKPASLEESLERCTLEKVIEYFEDKVLEEVRLYGLSGWSLHLVNGGWEGIPVGPKYEYAFVHMCHKIAGLGLMSHRMEWKNFMEW